MAKEDTTRTTGQVFNNPYSNSGKTGGYTPENINKLAEQAKAKREQLDIQRSKDIKNNEKLINDKSKLTQYSEVLGTKSKTSIWGTTKTSTYSIDESSGSKGVKKVSTKGNKVKTEYISVEKAAKELGTTSEKISYDIETKRTDKFLNLANDYEELGIGGKLNLPVDLNKNIEGLESDKSVRNALKTRITSSNYRNFDLNSIKDEHVRSLAAERVREAQKERGKELEDERSSKAANTTNESKKSIDLVKSISDIGREVIETSHQVDENRRNILAKVEVDSINMFDSNSSKLFNHENNIANSKNNLENSIRDLESNGRNVSAVVDYIDKYNTSSDSVEHKEAVDNYIAMNTDPTLQGKVDAEQFEFDQLVEGKVHELSGSDREEELRAMSIDPNTEEGQSQLREQAMQLAMADNPELFNKLQEDKARLDAQSRENLTNEFNSIVDNANKYGDTVGLPFNSTAADLNSYASDEKYLLSTDNLDIIKRFTRDINAIGKKNIKNKTQDLISQYIQLDSRNYNLFSVKLEVPDFAKFTPAPPYTEKCNLYSKTPARFTNFSPVNAFNYEMWTSEYESLSLTQNNTIDVPKSYSDNRVLSLDIINDNYDTVNAYLSYYRQIIFPSFNLVRPYKDCCTRCIIYMYDRLDKSPYQYVLLILPELNTKNVSNQSSNVVSINWKVLGYEI